MNRNTLVAKLLTPAGFIAALALFMLPLLSLSCSVPPELVAMAEDAGEAIPDDMSMSFDYSGIDLILNGDPSVTVTAQGMTATYDGLPADGFGGVPPSTEANNDLPAVPAYLQIPMIGAAALLVVGILVSFIPKTGARKGLVSFAAVVSAAALAYVVFIGGKDFGKDFITSSMGDLEEMPPSLGSFGFALENNPAVGFWAIAGVLVLVVLLQAIPGGSDTPAAAAAGAAPPAAPAESAAAPGGPAAPAAPGAPPSA